MNNFYDILTEAEGIFLSSVETISDLSRIRKNQFFL